MGGCSNHKDVDKNCIQEGKQNYRNRYILRGSCPSSQLHTSEFSETSNGF
ncbi:MAG: hypothetical protein K0S58_3391 [Nitrospira sp.]|nr:hypothetical protein [Nitrospira sp.]